MFSRLKTIAWPVAVVTMVAWLVWWSVRSPDSRAEGGIAKQDQLSLQSSIDGLDQTLHALWQEESVAIGEIPADRLDAVTPSPAADELILLRRLSLSLHGTIPSLEEIRRFQSDDEPHRLTRWASAMLEDPRYADYIAQRLERPFVGVEDGSFLVFRRDRFRDWLAGQLRENTPYDEIVRQMVAGRGVWTGNGEVNFVTSARVMDDFDENQLTARFTRAFLGQRIDCAQCHDHKFDEWKQSQFEGIAAHFGQLDISLPGVFDNKKQQYIIQEDDDAPQRIISPSVPFHPEWVPSEGTPREQLATWVTHRDNLRFDRAIVNRVWGLLFGRPFAHQLRVYVGNSSDAAAASDTTESTATDWVWTVKSVDDLPNPGDPRFGNQLAPLDYLAKDFRDHGRDLRRLILVIVSSQAFSRDSIHPDLADADPEILSDAQQDAARAKLEHLEARWAMFPLVRLRPEQVIGAMLQASHVETIDQNSHLVIRAQKFGQEKSFIQEFGDPGLDELEDRSGTIQQALLRMNGNLANELSEESPFRAPGQIRNLSSTPEKLLENIFLGTFTRYPTPDEQARLLPLLGAGRRQTPEAAVQDLYWTLFNAPEFSWSH
ncbi:MAG: DUF1549 domain-containing protein [Planctomycetaceae bacterium]